MPRLAEGLDLIGEYEGSGFKETPYLARRMDGQVLQLTRLLYLVAEAVDGDRDFATIAERVTQGFGRTVSADNVQFLVQKKLRPLGVLAAADGTSPQLKKADPMLALKFRTRLVPERAVHAVTSLFYPLFHRPVVLAVLGGLVVLDAWLFFVHGVAQSAREIAYQPALFLMVFGLIVISAAFHECGHATACRYGGAKPGPMGAGIYLVYPAFFSDVTDVYRLGKWGRVRTDLGGIYFNMIFSLLTAGAYFLTDFEPLLAIIVIQHLEMLHQLLPFLRLDGYYVISDVTGVPDLFSRIRPILRSLFFPWREPDPAVTALKPWVRVVVTAWVLSVVPILLYLLATIIVAVPRLVATAWDSLLVQYDKAAGALSDGEILATIAGAIQMVFLVLPLAGITYTLGLLGKKLGTAAWNLTEGKPALRASFASVALVSFGFLTLAWWPGEIYEPIRPDERGAVQDTLQAVGDTAQETLENLDELEEYVPEAIRPSLADELRDGLQSVSEYVPAPVRQSLAPGARQGQDDDGPAGERPGSSSTAATGAAGTPDDNPAPGAPSDDPDDPSPTGEQPSGAQEEEDAAGTEDGADAEDDAEVPSSGEPGDDPDETAPVLTLPDAEEAEEPEEVIPAPPDVEEAVPPADFELDEPEEEVAPAPEEPEEVVVPVPPVPEEAEPDSSGYYDDDRFDDGEHDRGGGDDYDDGGYDRGDGYELVVEDGGGYDRGGSGYGSDEDDDGGDDYGR